MPAEHDEVVEAGERIAVQHLEVGLGEVVRLLAALGEPAKEAEVVLAVLRRHTPPQKRATEPYRALRPLGIPGVAPAVAVLVAEVVRLPGVRGDDHGDTRRAELGRADDEGRKADAAVVGSELREVDARRPGADRDGDRSRTIEARPPDVDRIGHRDAVHERVVVGRDVFWPGAKQLQGQRVGVALDPERGGFAGNVALPREAGVHAENPDHGRRRPPARLGVARAVGAPVPCRVSDVEQGQVRSRRDRRFREPRERVTAWPECRGHLIHGLRSAQGARNAEVDGRALGQREADLRRVAHQVAVRRDGDEEPPVAGVFLGRARVGTQIEELRGSPIDAQRLCHHRRMRCRHSERRENDEERPRERHYPRAHTGAIVAWIQA